ncbi:MAG: chromosome partitioning protein ParB, partial [Psychromonas sp.]
LDPNVKLMLEQSDIEMGHARALLGCDQTEQFTLAKVVVAKSLNVRETELLVKKHLTPKKVKEVIPACDKTDKIISIFDTKLGLSVTAKTNKTGAGKLVIDYKSITQLEKLMAMIEAPNND